MMVNLENLKDFTWGQAALVTIYNSLRSKNKGWGGCMSALMAFALQHIKPLHELFNVESRPTTFPLLPAWSEALYKTLCSSYNNILREKIDECFDNLTPADIYDNPYSQIKGMPPYYER